jgi:hypothetical protein
MRARDVGVRAGRFAQSVSSRIFDEGDQTTSPLRGRRCVLARPGRIAAFGQKRCSALVPSDRFRLVAVVRVGVAECRRVPKGAVDHLLASGPDAATRALATSKPAAVGGLRLPSQLRNGSVHSGLDVRSGASTSLAAGGMVRTRAMHSRAASARRSATRQRASNAVESVCCQTKFCGSNGLRRRPCPANRSLQVRRRRAGMPGRARGAPAQNRVAPCS